MGYFKRFGDFCCGIALFAALMYVFSSFMAYSPRDVESNLEKLKLFFSDEPQRDYRAYLLLIALLLLSLAVSIVFRRMPYLCFAVSVLPMLRVIDLFDQNKLYERPMVYVICVSVHLLGGLVECIRRDGLDGKRRGRLAANLATLAGAGFFVYLLDCLKKVETLEYEEMNEFERTLWRVLDEGEAAFAIYGRLALIFAVCALIGFLLRDLYYIDAALAAIPFGYVVYLWCTDRLVVYGSVVVTLAAICFVARLALMLSCKPRLAGTANSARREDSTNSKTEGLERILRKR